MDVDLDTFLTTVYVEIDTFCAAQPAPVRRGPPPKMSDAEVLTLVVLGHWHGTSEQSLLRYADQHLRPWFPVLLSGAAFNRRARRLAPHLAGLLQAVADRLTVGCEPFEIVDGLPVPLAHPTRGGRASRFTAEEASIGRGGTGKGFYYGVSLLLSVSASGVITGLVTAPAHMDERWQLSALLSWRVDPTALPLDVEAVPPPGHGRTLVGPTGHRLGPVTAGRPVTGLYLADRGFTGQAWQTAWRERCQATVVTPATVPPARRRWLHRVRQRIETVNAVLTDTLHLKYPLAHTEEGLITRLVAKCVALNLGILVNRCFGRPDLALGTLYAG